jgi:hypothetical protein
MSEGSDTENVHRRSRKRKRWACRRDSDSSSDSSDSPYEPERNRRKRVHSDSTGRSNLTDCLLGTPPAGVQQILRSDGSGYESDWEDFTADEREDTSGQTHRNILKLKARRILIRRFRRKQKGQTKIILPVVNPVKLLQLRRQKEVKRTQTPPLVRSVLLQHLTTQQDVPLDSPVLLP